MNLAILNNDKRQYVFAQIRAKQIKASEYVHDTPLVNYISLFHFLNKKRYRIKYSVKWCYIYGRLFSPPLTPSYNLNRCFLLFTCCIGKQVLQKLICYFVFIINDYYQRISLLFDRVLIFATNETNLSLMVYEESGRGKKLASQSAFLMA